MKKRLFSTILACVMAIGVATACKNLPDNGDITVYMPDGAPAIAFAQMMKNDVENDGVSYRVVDNKLITEKVTGRMKNNADLCVLPLTTATQHLGNGEKYQMVGAVTHGNLYIISKDNTLSFTAQNLADLKGKTVGVLQLKDTPGLIFKTVLQKYGIAYSTEPSNNAVCLQALSSAAEIPTMEENGVDIFVLAEPAVTAQKGKGWYSVGDLQALYGEGGYPQAVLVAKNSVIAENGEWLNGFLEALQSSAAVATTLGGEEIVSTITAHLEDSTYSTSLKPALLTEAALARCSIRFEYTEACKQKTAAFLTEANAVDGVQAVLPNEDFYWLD